MKPLLAHLRLELALLARNGESLLLTLGIPVMLLCFFANVDVLPIDGEPIHFLAPGVLALAVLSTALVNLAIATGFEREYGVLKRFGLDAARAAPPARREDDRHPRRRGRADRGALAPRGRVRLGPVGRAARVRRARSCSAPSRARASACAWPAR